MTTNKPELLPRWADEVRGILEAAGIPESRLAEELERPRSVVHRYLNGQHEPKLETIEKVNAATAQLIAQDDQGEYIRVSEYLRAVHLANIAERTGNIGHADFEWALSESIDQIKIVAEYLIDGAASSILRQIQERRKGLNGQRQVVRLATDLLLASRERLLRHLTGKVPGGTRFEEVCKIFKRRGFDLTPLFRTDSEVAVRRSEDQFYLEVQRVLADTRVEPLERWQLERRILAAHSDAVSEIYHEQFALLKQLETKVRKGAQKR